MSKSRFFLLLCAICLSLSLFAIPARKDAIVVNQPDGSTLTVYNHGDEHFHYLTDENGRWLQQNADGRYVEIEPLSDEEIENRRNNSPKLKYQRRRQQQDYSLQRNIMEHGIIILVNFSDKAFISANTHASMQEMHSGDNYTFNGATGSCRKYFYDQSMGKYNPQFDVVGPLTLPQTMSYYGTNNSKGDDNNVVQMVVDACTLADTQWNVDFSQYDNDGDGYVDYVYIIYAGYSEAEGAPSNTVWPHAWAIEETGASLTLDGKRINSYACGSELSGSRGSTRAGIGTFCHEFSHVLGLPDFYVTNNASHKTLGSWDIMDYGPYNNDGRTPPSYSAYERFFMGWLTPEYINKADNLTLEQLQVSNRAFIITTAEMPNMNPLNPSPNVFYLLENRQQTSWDKYLVGHGLMITKISYSYEKWYSNTVNNTYSDMGVDIIEAKPVYSYYTTDNATDLFPAGADSYTGIANRHITDIKENNGVITFKFMGGTTNKDVSFNYAQALYDSTYNSTQGYSWEIDLYNLTAYNEETESYEYDARMYFAIYTKKRFALSGSYNISQMDYAGIFIGSGSNAEQIQFTTCNAVLTYLGKDSEGYDKYQIAVKATDANNVIYNVSEQLSVYCWDYKTDARLYMTDENNNVNPPTPDNQTLKFNFAQALYSPNDNRNNQCFWEIQLYNMLDNETKDYDVLLYFSILTNTPTAISGQYSIADLDYARLAFINAPDTTWLDLTSGTISIEYIKNDANGYPIYNVSVDATAQNGNRYKYDQQLTIYCWNLTNSTILDMHEVEDALDNLEWSDINVSEQNSTLIVNTQGGVQIYNVAGQLLYANYSNGNLNIEGLPNRQLLILRVNDRTLKIML